MNAAFLLVTSAMLVGQPGPAPKVVAPAPAAPAPVVSSGCGAGGCGYSCDSSCCDSFGHRLRARFGGLFNRCNSCDTCNSCTTYQPRYTHSHSSSCNTCDTCSQPRAWTWQRRCHDHGCNTCATTTCQSSCNTGCCGSSGFFARFRSSWGHGGCDSCSTGCNSGGCGGIVTTPGAPPVKGGEKIDAPKKMPVEAPKVVPPVEKKPAPVPGKVMIDNAPAPIAPNAIPAIPVAPRVEVVAPAPTPSAVPVPRVEGNPRDPF